MALRKEETMTKHVPFDTLAFAKKLESRGVQVKEAEAYAEVLADVLEAGFSSKNETTTAINNLSKEVHELRSEMNAKFAEVRSEINMRFSEVIKWVFGISFAQAALIISVLKFFH
jgi:chromosome segregation ATPase